MRKIVLRALAAGVATFIPGMATLHRMVTKAPGTDSARYCYSVWLRHLVMSHTNGLCQKTPRSVAELGPGESIGIGLAALLSGADSYVGLDVIHFTNLRRNLAIFDALVELFRAQTAIPGPDEFPEVKPALKGYDYPRSMLSQVDHSPARIARIRESIEAPNAPGSMIRYVAPWDRNDVVERGSVDMIFSQAVMEHVDDLAGAYAAMREWLAPGGFISHQIDMRSHGTADSWDGHWKHSDLMWKLLRGSRSYFINRAPHSAHVQHLSRSGFSIVLEGTVKRAAQIKRADLAPKFAHLTDDDLTTSGAFILARAH